MFPTPSTTTITPCQRPAASSPLQRNCSRALPWTCQLCATEAARSVCEAPTLSSRLRACALSPPANITPSFATIFHVHMLLPAVLPTPTVSSNLLTVSSNLLCALSPYPQTTSPLTLVFNQQSIHTISISGAASPPSCTTHTARSPRGIRTKPYQRLLRLSVPSGTELAPAGRKHQTSTPLASTPASPPVATRDTGSMDGFCEQRVSPPVCKWCWDSQGTALQSLSPPLTSPSGPQTPDRLHILRRAFDRSWRRASSGLLWRLRGQRRRPARSSRGSRASSGRCPSGR
mmetsp:Transcript_34588/g.67708  ORF Transcript_34588/g.67708 Transcript_34588/m.67708 type:complete len:288 (+) Transcript_34588:209-1072(+)